MRRVDAREIHFFGFFCGNTIDIFALGFQDGSPTSKTFEHIPSEIGAEEAEEVGVEHLLRDIKDTTVGTLSQRVTNQLLGLKGLHSQIREIKNYLLQVRIEKWTKERQQKFENATKFSFFFGRAHF